jgi:hypothetical protein
MDVPDREQTLQNLLNAGTATRVEQVLDDAGIRMERSGLDPDQIFEFWRQLWDDLKSTALKARSPLVLHGLEGYARAAIRTRENR